MSENYQNWVERVTGGRTAKPLTSGEIVKSSAGTSFGAVEFSAIEKKDFLAEVGKKGNYYIYHFYPDPKYSDDPSKSHFYETLADSFLEIFRRKDQIEVDWVPEMKAWAVRVSGWTNNIWGDELAIRVINKFSEILSGEKS